MRGQLLKITLFFISVLGIFFWLCLNFGLIKHWLVKGRIRQLSGSERKTVEREFYGQDKSKYFFAGTLAKINHSDEGGVWVWTNQGLKYFPADQYTFYSYYDLCAARSNDGESGFEVNDSSRVVTSNIEEWAELATAGDFVQLATQPGNGDDGGSLKEIYAYSQPLFLPLNLELLCQS